VQNNVNAFDAEGKPVTFEGAAVTYDALGRAVEFTAGGRDAGGPLRPGRR
jgi:hypothetical protein